MNKKIDTCLQIVIIEEVLYMEIHISIYFKVEMNQVEFFKCLADPTRLDIVMMIVQQGERCVCDLTAGLDLSQPKISRHLALLRSGHILQDRRQGQWVYYRLHDHLPGWCHEVLNIAASENPKFQQADELVCTGSNCCN